MKLLEKLCKELGVEVGEEWLGSDGKLYIVEEEAILNLEPWQDSVTGDGWELCSGTTYQKILTGEVKPVWEPKEGDKYYCPYIDKPEDERFDFSYWEDSIIDNWFLENGLAFRTAEEAIECTNKMLEAIKESD